MLCDVKCEHHRGDHGRSLCTDPRLDINRLIGRGMAFRVVRGIHAVVVAPGLLECVGHYEPKQGRLF